MLAPALVEAHANQTLRPVFGRMGFRAIAAMPRADSRAAPQAIAAALTEVELRRPIHVQGWAVDEPISLSRSSEAEALAETVADALGEGVGAATAALARERDGVLGQICAVGEGMWVLGVVAASEAVSLSPGGRQRMRRSAEAPSRAAMKLDEALAELGYAPGRGESCVDLGAAPGGWTQRVVDRGSRVVAVDPANLRPGLESHPRVTHLKQSAFTFEPEEPVDWLLCDMAW
ncbi:MAG TPA: SAM-dependent methyltransferase, partial [Myxococcaceae bacterium]|nr:SAM-dependent methyltransferase [Myxococcaceae bacterium]